MRVQPIDFDDWKRNRRSNGYILTELLCALLLISMLVMAYVPLVVQAMRNMEETESREELSRQGLVMEETIYGTLRFATAITVTKDTIRCRDRDNIKTGFTVSGKRVYKIMSDGTEQPLTGAGTTGPNRIVILPYEDRPYFLQHDEAIEIAMVVYDSQRKREWPCVITVVPLTTQWDIES